MRKRKNACHLNDGQTEKRAFKVIVICAVFFASLVTSCEKTSYFLHPALDPVKTGDVTAPVIRTVVPVNNALSVATSANPSVTFNEIINPATLSVSTFTLKQGANLIPGSVTVSDSIATFVPATSLTANTVYTGTVTSGVQDIAGNPLTSDYTWSFTTAAIIDKTPPTVLSVVPDNNNTTASTTTKITISFSEAMDASTISTTSYTVKQGTTSVSGTVDYTGTTATFTPSSALSAGKVFTVTLTTAAKDIAGNALAANYTWGFTTAAAADVTPPTLLSVVPASGATGIVLNSKVTATFSEALDATTISAATFTLKQGTNVIAGVVTYTGTTATFTPASPLTGGLSYTATITTGIKDLSGNAMAANYSWSFTSLADIIPPTVVSVIPANSATSVSVNGKVIVTFSETMNSMSLTTSTFTLSQGSTVINGTVVCSGSSATFTPSSALTASTVYTVTISGAKDMAGNAIASNYSSSFTTGASGKSFSADVVPILNLCNTCHTHPWTTSPVATTFYANLVSGGYVKPATPTTSKIYVKLSGGHPPSTVSTTQVNTILTWMNEGSLNN